MGVPVILPSGSIFVVERQPDSHLSLLFHLFAAEQRVRTLVTSAMADCGLRPDEYAVYSVLFDEGPHAPTDLARRVGMPPTTMSHYVRAMLERGHVEREIVASDRRSYRLRLTDAGLAAHANASRAFAQADQRFMTALEIDEAQATDALASIGRAAERAATDLAADSVEATA
jgi:DNA-binding MarR family transcriptional regulator